MLWLHAMVNASFKRKLIILVAAVATAGLTARLGVWQLSRAAEKQALQSSLDERSTLPILSSSMLAMTPQEALEQQHRRVTLQGEWVVSATVFLDNRQMNGRPGFFVLTPMQLANGDAVLVQRGWAPRDIRDRTLVPTVVSPKGQVLIEGRVAPTPGRLYEFSGAPTGVIRQNIDLTLFADEIKLPLRPLSVLQLGTVDDGLLRQWPAPAVDIGRHHGYAFQWFALCALTLGLYAWYQLIRPRRNPAHA
jgi:surfeit locus 1 family protein